MLYFIIALIVLNILGVVGKCCFLASSKQSMTITYSRKEVVLLLFTNVAMASAFFHMYSTLS